MRVAAHLRDRLSERTVPAVAERAFELLRFPGPLVALLKSQEQREPGFRAAERLALDLTPDPEGAKLVVNRDGVGVTCLGQGMACNLPTVPWPHVERYLQERADLLRRTVAEQRLKEAEEEGASPLDRCVTYGYRMTRAEYDALRALSPLLTSRVAKSVAQVSQWLRAARRAGKLARRDPRAAETLWREYASACVGLMATGHEKAMVRSCLTACASGDVLLATRGLWLCVNQPERTILFAEEAAELEARAGPGGGSGPVALPGHNALLLATPLLCIARRFPHLRQAAVGSFSRLSTGGLRDLDRFRHAMSERDRDVEAHRLLYLASMVHVWLSALCPPEVLERVAGLNPALRASAIVEAIQRGDRDLPHLGLLADPWHAQVLAAWQPLRDMARPRPVQPVRLAGDGDRERERVDVWRVAVTATLLSPTLDDTPYAEVLSAAPVEALVPREEPDAAWRLSQGVQYVLETLPGIVTGGRRNSPQVRQDPKVGPNEPCPCGSGKKYKRCHGAG
jgi:hypothetical protein